MADRISRIYIDSAYETEVSASNGDFRIDLSLPVFVEASSHLRVEGLIFSHVWPVIDYRNNRLYLREVDSGGTSYHRIITLDDGNYNIGTLALELQRQLRLGTRIADGQWTVTSDEEGRLSIVQSSPVATARLHSQSDVRGKTQIPINWLFADTTGAGTYVATSTSWPQAWAAVNVQEALPARGSQDASAMIGLPYRLLDFSPLLTGAKN
jgi:hypothetical protein